MLARPPFYACCLIAAASLVGGAKLALAHPVSASMALWAFCGTLLVLLFRPGLWLFLVPAALPVLNFMPWTGWQMAEEFDLLLLCTFVAGYGRLAWDLHWEPHDSVAPPAGPSHLSRLADGAILLFLLLSVLSMLRGFCADGCLAAWAHSRELGLFQGYTEPMNSVRQFKSVVLALLCVPLLRREFRSAAEGAVRAPAGSRFAAGMLMGLALVMLVVLWERIAYPGLLNFSTRYRTTALFPEMHMGGAAIDAYLVLTVPFVVWALLRARRPRQWFPLAVLALVACYAVLTTFSRGVYVAVAVPLAVWGLVRWASKARMDWRQPLGLLWRKQASVWLIVALGLEITLVASGGSFLMERMAQSQSDLDDRVAHWRRALSLLGGPLDWLLGRGLGRFPAEYARLGPETEFPGAVALLREAPTAAQFQAFPLAVERNFVRLYGPASNDDIGGLFMLNQRVDVPVAQLLTQAPGSGLANGSGFGLTLALEVRVLVETRFLVKVCEKHLLYEGECLVRHINLYPSQGTWQALVVPFRSAGLNLEKRLLHRSAMLSFTVLTPAASIDLRAVALMDWVGRNLIANGNFANDLSRWFPSAGSYYLPWHVDNLYLELLIERGLAGLALFLGLVAASVRGLAQSLGPAGGWPDSIAAIILWVITGIHLLGFVNSMMDAPRVAFLLFFLIFWGNGHRGATPQS